MSIKPNSDLSAFCPSPLFLISPLRGSFLKGHVLQQAVRADACTVCLYAVLHLSSHSSPSASVNLLPAQQPANQPVQACCQGNGCLGDTSFVSHTSFSSSFFLSLPYSHSFFLFHSLCYLFAHRYVSLPLSSHLSFCLTPFLSLILPLTLFKWTGCSDATVPSNYKFIKKMKIITKSGFLCSISRNSHCATDTHSQPALPSYIVFVYTRINRCRLDLSHLT